MAFSLVVLAMCLKPWGADADLVEPAAAVEEAFCTPLDGVVRFHQRVISPADGPRSHYLPSSSTYMLRAVRRFGIWKGFSMGCDRLMRENSDAWLYPLVVTRDGDVLKWDPVPHH